jgi:hypothetical protein
MSQAERISEPTCLSAQAALDLISAISAWTRAETMGRTGHPFTPDIGDRIDTLTREASWLRPLSPEGALLHVMLASAAVDALDGEEPTIRAVQRHLYAIRAFLAAHADLEGWQGLSDHFMPEPSDPVPAVMMMTGT